MTISLGLGKPSYQTARSSCQHREVKKVTATILFGVGCAGGPYSLACAAGLDEEGFPSKPDALARESVLRTQQNRSNPEIME
jgi:hypothetical protein